MNIYRSSTYRKDLSWVHFDDEPRVQERYQEKGRQSCTSVFVAYLKSPNQGSNCLGGTFSNRDNVRAPIQFGRERKPQHLHINIFTSLHHFHINSTSVTRPVKRVFPALKSTSHFLPQYTVSHRSDSGSEANSSCYHRSDT